MQVKHYALVVGKFLPFHKGHELVINTALKNHSRVVVMTYTSNEYGWNHLLRKTWIETVCPGVEVIAMPPLDCPDDNDPEDVHRLFCAENLRAQVYGTPSCVYSSETYGKPFAKYLANYFRDEDIDYYDVDLLRDTVPISGTKLRANPELMLQYCHKFVYTKRVAILGGESTGKTSVVDFLHSQGHSTVREYGRDWWSPFQGHNTMADLQHIADTQITDEYFATMVSTGGVVFCDTSPLTTAFYADELFHRVPEPLAKQAMRGYDYYVLLSRGKDFEFVQDGTRADASFSDRGNGWIEHVIQGLENIQLVRINQGSVTERARQVESLII